MQSNMLKNILLCFTSCILSFGQIFAVSNQDLLREVTKDARQESVIVDKEAKDIFDDHWGIDLNIGDWFDGNPENDVDMWRKDSLFVKVTRFMLKLAILAAIPMILYAGIKIVLSLGDEGKLKSALVEIGHIAIGILLALLAVMIIYIITSLTRGTLDANII
jgi:amino acid transporter